MLNFHEKKRCLNRVFGTSSNMKGKTIDSPSENTKINKNLW